MKKQAKFFLTLFLVSAMLLGALAPMSTSLVSAAQTATAKAIMTGMGNIDGYNATASTSTTSTTSAITSASASTAPAATTHGDIELPTIDF